MRSRFHVPGLERLWAALGLSLLGGFLDVYSFMCRGHVFANAVTGNLVLLGHRLASGQPAQCGKYLVAICCYAGGVLVASSMREGLEKRGGWLHWSQAVAILEVGSLVIVPLIPYGQMDWLANSLIAFSCALQVQAFRHVRTLPFASTMCTGNLRSGMEALSQVLWKRDRAALEHVFSYLAVIFCFVAGACLGALMIFHYGYSVIWLGPVALALLLLTFPSSWQTVSLRRFLRGRQRKK